MAPFRLILLVPVFALATFGCGDDSGGGAADTGTGTGTSTGGTSMAPTTVGAADTSTGGGNEGTTAAVDGTGSSGDSGGGTATGSGSGSDTGADDPCDMCIVESCEPELVACVEDPACVCWTDCIDKVEDPDDCVAKCGEQPQTLADVGDCLFDECSEPCELVQDPGTTYDPCETDEQCEEGTTCIDALGYCSIVCEGDASNCPAPPDGDAAPTCLPGIDDACGLDCAGNLTCPTGTSCNPLGGGSPVCVAD